MAPGLRKMLHALDRGGRFIENAALVTLFATMMLLAVGQIVLREVFATGVIWIEGLIRIIVLWLAMVGSIAASRDDRHIRIDALSHVLPKGVARATRVLVDAFAAAVCALLAWHTWQYLKLEIEWQETVLLDTPAWLAHFIVPLAFALVAWRFAVLVAIGIFVPQQDDGDSVVPTP